MADLHHGPFVGIDFVRAAVRLPSKYGAKYRYGLVNGSSAAVFVTRGLGEAGVPLRVNAPPEVFLLTLVAG